MHVNVSAIVIKFIFLMLQKSDPFAVVNYLLTVAITITTICIVGCTAERISTMLKK